MSWMLHSAGSKIGVKQKVETDPHLPAEVKSAIQAIVDKMPVNRGVVVETHGHIDTGVGQATIIVRALDIA